VDPKRTDTLRGAFGMTSTAAASPAAPAKPTQSKQDLYDSEYKKFIAKGMSPKQAAAFANQVVKRSKAGG
jgi:hypothetical protein